MKETYVKRARYWNQALVIYKRLDVVVPATAQQMKDRCDHYIKLARSC